MSDKIGTMILASTLPNSGNRESTYSTYLLGGLVVDLGSRHLSGSAKPLPALGIDRVFS